MNTLRLLAHALRANNSGIQIVQKPLNHEQMCHLKRAFHHRSTGAVFIRNDATRTATTTTILTGNQRRHHHQIQCGLLLPSQHQVWNTTTPQFCSTTRRLFTTKQCPDQTNKSDTKSAVASTDVNDILFGEASKLGLFAKFKLMYKKYWYVLIPVHVVTSAGWLGGFYYLSQSGVDVPAVLQYLHLSETIIEKVQGSSLGHWAIAYLCYKVATPLRYAITLGGTTISIKYLVQAGYIKPMPTKAEILQMYEDKKAQRAADKAQQQEEKSQREQK
ncbi:protein FAM210A-like [Musca autumnalis]|uniref:protein FAM210A-like n=1 Tax=Musca autumnalis TaxID=221902 RepID=UPI003CF4B3EA